jgi:hypothetical protein
MNFVHVVMIRGRMVVLRPTPACIPEMLPINRIIVGQLSSVEVRIVLLVVALVTAMANDSFCQVMMTT